MKSILFSIAIVISICTVGLAQSAKLNSGDSIRIELERTAITTELIDLRDSISISIIAFDSKVKKSIPSEGVKLTAASKELTGYKGQLDLNIEEIVQTGRNSWNADSMARIQLATVNTRREYKRIITLL